ncbi:MAG: alkaline phosphatase [Balneolaceae bacterium]
MNNNKKNRSKGISRSDFLKIGALSTITVGSGLLGRPIQAIPKFKSEGDAKNVIFLVVDGMSSGTLTLADILKQRQYGSKTNWIRLYESDKKFHRGLMDMASLDSPVTDSAAAASSWGCGHRINNGAVNMGIKGQRYTPVLEIFRRAGKATGLVTTARITHATPAGFCVSAPSRNLEAAIAEQYLARGVDVYMGGGKSHFDSEKRNDKLDLYDLFGKNGYTIVHNKTELKRATRNSKLLGLFADSHLPYTVDHNSIPELKANIPTLSEMTNAAIQRLEKNPEGFILQVEAGRVDHAAHGNDPAALVYDQLAFDEVIGDVLEYVENKDDTLLIITTDHGNANPGLNGTGVQYRDSGRLFDRLQQFRHSNEWIFRELSIDSTLDQIKERIEYATRLQISNHEAQMFKDSFEGKLRTPYRALRTPDTVLAQIEANYIAVNWIGTMHTSDYVELAAIGPGSEQLKPFVRNTELFNLMVDMAGVRKYAGG